MRGLLLAFVALLPAPVAARADTVVALGDFAISGDAGRWAGNTNGAYTRTDVLGPTAYHDVAGAESIPGCHRSKAAEVHIGDGVKSVDLRGPHLHAHERRQVRQAYNGGGTCSRGTGLNGKGEPNMTLG